MKMNVTMTANYPVTIYIGGRMGYDGLYYHKDALISAITDYQTKDSGSDDFCGVTVQETQFVVGNYLESGFEISTINYPRFPKSKQDIELFMIYLGWYLMGRLKQNRVTVCTPTHSHLLTAPDAQLHPTVPDEAGVQDSEQQPG